MTLATTPERGTTPMNKQFSPAEGGGIFTNPQTQSRTRTISAKMGESLFIVEYDGSIPLALPPEWPFPEYEVRRKLPMKECMECRSQLFEGVRIRKALRTSWVFRKRGEFFWHRICWTHMKPAMREVIREMYSR